MKNAMIAEILKELRQDHLNNAKTQGEVLAEIKNLRIDIKELRDVDEKIHNRIDKKDDRIRGLESRAGKDEERITALETRLDTSNRNNKIWVGAAFSIGIIIATVLTSLF